MNPPLSWFRGAAAAVLLVLVVCEVALAFTNDSGPTLFSKALAVAVADDQGYHHWLVFEAVPSRLRAWTRYSVGFWVDSFVSIDPGALQSLVFEGSPGSVSAALVSWRMNHDLRNAKDSPVMTFSIDAAALDELRNHSPARLRLVLKSGKTMGFRVLDQAIFREAIDAVRK